MLSKVWNSKAVLLLRHKLLLMKWVFSRSSTDLDFLGEAWLSCVANYRTEHDPIKSYELMFEAMRQRGFSGRMLELGGGYSTVVFNSVFTGTGASILSVDVNPSKYDFILNSRKCADRFLGSIDRVDELTVNLEDARWGIVSIIEELMSYPNDQVVLAVSKFIDDEHELQNVVKLLSTSSKSSLVEIVEQHANYISDLKFYESRPLEAGYCRKVVNESKVFDAIFFDCGELSSNAEWLLLKDSIPKGGFVLLHDVFFPKSIKNFLVAAYIELSDEWTVICTDMRSSQGALLALKN